MKQLKKLRKLFAMMIKSHKKYTDPSELLHSVVDDFGTLSHDILFLKL